MNQPSQQIPKVIYATLNGYIDSALLSRVFGGFNQAINNHVEAVHLLIQSTGGLIGEGVAMHNYLKNLPIQLATYNAGSVSSIAVLAYLAGAQRYCSKAATFMIHKSHISPGSHQTSAQLEDLGRGLDIDNARTEAILKEYVTLPSKLWKIHANGNLHITSAESLKYGIANQISDFAPPKGAQIFNI